MTGSVSKVITDQLDSLIDRADYSIQYNMLFTIDDLETTKLKLGFAKWLMKEYKDKLDTTIDTDVEFKKYKKDKRLL